MARVLVANWCDVASFECEREDPSVECVEDMAAPQLMGAIVGQEPPLWWLKRLMREVEDDLDERMDGETDPLLLEPRRQWKISGWTERSEPGRPGMSMDLYEEDEYVATVVVHAVELAAQ